MSATIYNRIANGCFVLILALAIGAERFPDLEMVLGGLALAVGVGAIGMYFFHRFRLIGEEEDREGGRNGDCKSEVMEHSVVSSGPEKVDPESELKSLADSSMPGMWSDYLKAEMGEFRNLVELANVRRAVTVRSAGELSNWTPSQRVNASTYYDLTRELVWVSRRNLSVNQSTNVSAVDNEHWLDLLSKLLEPRSHARQSQRVRVQAPLGVEINVGGTRIVVDEQGNVVIEARHAIKSETSVAEPEGELVGSPSKGRNRPLVH